MKDLHIKDMPHKNMRRKDMNQNFARRLFMLPLLWWAASSFAAAPYCVDGICLGATVDQLSVKWKPLPPTTQERLDAEAMLRGKDVKTIYRERNELLLAAEATLRDLYPYVIRRQVFDSHVLEKLREVKAYCSSTTLTGEVMVEGKDRLFVTLRAVPDNGGVGKLRIRGGEKFSHRAKLNRPAAVGNSLKETGPAWFPQAEVLR